MLNNKINKPPHPPNQSPDDVTIPHINLQTTNLSTLKTYMIKNPSFISKSTLPIILASLFSRNDSQMLSYILSITSNNKDFNCIYREFLFQCCEFGKKDLLKQILKYRSIIDLNTQNNYGDTPLHILCSKGEVECIKEVIKFNPRKDIKNNSGLIAYDYAIGSGNKDIISLFRSDENKNVLCANERYYNKHNSNNNNNNNNNNGIVIEEESDYTMSGIVENYGSDSDTNFKYNNNNNNKFYNNDSDSDRVKIIPSECSGANSYILNGGDNNNNIDPNTNNTNTDVDKTVDEQEIFEEEYKKQFKPKKTKNVNINTYDSSSLHKITESIIKVNTIPSSSLYVPSNLKTKLHKNKTNTNSYTSSTTSTPHKHFNTSTDILTSSNFNILTTNTNNKRYSNNLPNSQNILHSSFNHISTHHISDIMSISPSYSINTSISLYSFLKEIELQSYTELLCNNGFDDVSVLIEQTKTDIAISDKILKDIGFNLIGDRAKILVRLEEKAGLFGFGLEKEKVYYRSVRNKNGLMRMLSTIKMEKFTDYFINAGYPSADLLIVQMLSRQPLDEKVLELEIGIEKIGYRMRIMNKLKTEAGIYAAKVKKNGVVFETRKAGSDEEFCNMCCMF